MEKPKKTKLPSPQERLELILLGLARKVPVKELCRQAGVSRELFYRWLREVREAGLRALEAKAPGPKQVAPEKAESLALKLQKRVQHLEKEQRKLRKARDRWQLLAETARRIIQRNAWGPAPEEPRSKKNAMRSSKPANFIVESGSRRGNKEPQPRPLPGAGAFPAAPTGDGSLAESAPPGGES
jgi:transposase-like protein